MTNKQLLVKLTEDMELRGFSKYTKYSYLSKTKHLVKYFNKPLDKVNTTQLREYLLEHLREKKLSERSINYYNSVIRFVYEVTLDKIINTKQLPMYKKKKKLLKTLTKDELGLFFGSCTNYMYKTIFMLIYGSGLRISEAANLKTKDIDSANMRIFIRDGKGKKERYTILSKTTLDMLREYYKRYRPCNEEGYLFLNSDERPLQVERIRVFFRKYIKMCGLVDSVTVHSLRHCFATHLIEQGASLLQVKELLGHSSIRSTMEYLHITKTDINLESPLDSLVNRDII